MALSLLQSARTLNVLHWPQPRLKGDRSSYMNEEFEKRWERQVEFILNQQVQLDAETVKLKAAQAQTEQSLDRAAKNISHLAGFIHEGFGLLMNIIKENDSKIRALLEE